MCFETSGRHERYPVDIVNISTDGIHCQSPQQIPMDVSSAAVLEFPSLPQVHRADAKVRYRIGGNAGGTRIGLQFTKRLPHSLLEALRSPDIVLDRRTLDRRMDQDKLLGNREYDRRGQWNGFLSKRYFSHHAVELQRAGVYFYMQPLQSATAAHVTVEGRDMIMMSSNNYLGLTTHPKVVESAIEAIRKYGSAPSASSLLGGTLDIHLELEEKLAKFKGVEAVSLFSSGYVTNVTTLTTVLQQGDAVFDDERNHASLIDGSRLSGAEVRAYKHLSPTDLQKKLNQTKCAHRLVVTDSIFSMDGDLAPLPEIFQICRNNGAALMVDEAHATGVLGETGRGALQHFGMEGKADIVMGTLSKSLAGVGGFIGGSKELIRILKHTARAFVFSAYMPPSVCGAVLAALKIIDDEPERRQQLWRNSEHLRSGLKEMGFQLTDSVSPIIPVVFRSELETNKMTKGLRDKGIYASPVIFPAVKKNATRIRLTVMATHTERDIAYVLKTFRQVRDQLSL